MPHPDTTCGVETIIYEDILSLTKSHCYHILLLFQYFSTNLITKTRKNRIISGFFSIFEEFRPFFLHRFSTASPHIFNSFFHIKAPEKHRFGSALRGSVISLTQCGQTACAGRFSYRSRTRDGRGGSISLCPAAPLPPAPPAPWHRSCGLP